MPIKGRILSAIVKKNADPDDVLVLDVRVGTDTNPKTGKKDIKPAPTNVKYKQEGTETRSELDKLIKIIKRKEERALK